MLINRSFWPTYPVLGDALLGLAERATDAYEVFVILQDRSNIKQKSKELSRGHKVKFRPLFYLSSSKNGILWRGLDATIFMLWVMINLLIIRPNKIYVSTDPPILIPFIVMLYSRVFKANYIYHVQDIHPEATDLIKNLNKKLFRFLKWMDIQATKYAKEIITITPDMENVITRRLGKKREVYLVSNPSLNFNFTNLKKERKKGIVFCGNLGRFQLIPLVISAIEEYFKAGGKLDFKSAGDGFYAEEIKTFSTRHPKFDYLGFLDEQTAAQITSEYSWVLLPIDDRITEFAFPSKTSSYICSDTNILAICGEQTSVAKLITNKKLGVVVNPNIAAIVQVLFKIENSDFAQNDFLNLRKELKPKLAIESFVFKVFQIINKKAD